MAYPYRKRIKPRLGTPLNKGHRLSKGLVGAWLMNEGAGTKALDLSGNGNTGTFVADTNFVSGKFGSALDFDGAGDYVSFASSKSLKISDGTFIVWLKSSSIGYFDGVISLYISTNDRISFVGGNIGNEMWLYIREDGATRVNLLDGVVIADGKWHQCVCTFSHAEARIYRDGIYLVNSIGDETTDWAVGTPTLYIAQDGAADYYPGSIDHVLIYNRVLSASEIAQLYREPFAMFQKEDIAVLSPTNLLTGLVSYWKLDDTDNTNALDAHGDNDGTQGGAVTDEAAGKIGTAFNFDGGNSYVNIGDAASLKITDEITISAWVKIQSDSGGWNYIVSKGYPWYAGRSYGLAWHTGTNRIYFSIRNAANDATLSDYGSITYDTAVWYHVVGTFDGTVRVYLNGVLGGIQLSTGVGIYDSTEAVWLGSENDENLEFNGLVDEVGIWNRALTQTEITELYNSGSGLAYPFTEAPPVTYRRRIIIS